MKLRDSPGARTALVVFLLALGVHLPVGLQYLDDPFFETPVSDALSYHRWALRIAESGPGAEPVFHQAPGFPLLLSAVYASVPGDLAGTAALVVQAVLTSLAIALLVPLGRLWLGSLEAGVAGAALALLHGPFVFHSLKLLPVPLALASLGAAWTAVGLARARGSAAAGAAAGVLSAVAATARAEMLLAAPLALAAVLSSGDGTDRRARRRSAAALALAFLATLAPVTVHNFLQGDLVLVASSGGENLFIGNQRGARGDYSAIHPAAGDLFSERALARLEAERAEGRALLPSEVSAYWRHRALAEVAADPAGWLRLELLKLGRVLHPGDPTDAYSFALERSAYLPALHLLPAPPWLLLLGGAAGVALALRARARRSWPLVALAALQVGVLVVFFVNTRLRLPLLYALAPFSGLALVEAWRRWRSGETRRLVGVLVVVATAATLASAWLTRSTPRDRVRLASVLSVQGRLDESLSVLEPALDPRAPYGLALDQAGWVLQKRGDLEGARRRYVEALEAGMPAGRGASTRTRLAGVLERLGEPDAAGAEHDRAVAMPEANAGTLFERGMFRLRRGDREGAVRDLRESARLDPAWGAPREALTRLGVAP